MESKKKGRKREREKEIIEGGNLRKYVEYVEINRAHLAYCHCLVSLLWLAIDTEGAWAEMWFYSYEKITLPLPPVGTPWWSAALCFLRLTVDSVALPTFPCKVYSFCVLRAGDLGAIDSQHHVSDLQPSFLSSAVCKKTDNKGLIEAGSQIECPAVCPLFKKLFL